MICSKCKKYPAVVFLTQGADKKPNMGLCIKCAKEMGVKPVIDLMDKMGISDDDIETVQDQLTDLMESSKIDFQDSDIFGEGMSAEDAAPFLKDLFCISGNDSEKFEETKEETADKDKKNSGKKKAKKGKRKYIEAYCYDLTKRARDGKLDKIIGRDQEIGRVIQILSRRSKNNPCLIGEPGVGKTAIAEGLALRIAEGKVPARMRDKEIQLLDLTLKAE